jgi:hypothetical protein
MGFAGEATAAPILVLLTLSRSEYSSYVATPVSERYSTLAIRGRDCKNRLLT